MAIASLTGSQAGPVKYSAEAMIGFAKVVDAWCFEWYLFKWKGSMFCDGKVHHSTLYMRYINATVYPSNSIDYFSPQQRYL